MKTTPPEAVLSNSRRCARLCGLHGLLPQQLMAAGERAEELVVQVVPVGDDDQRRILHRRMQHDPPGVERHRQALARTLRVPDHADAPVAGLGVGLTLRQSRFRLIPPTGHVAVVNRRAGSPRPATFTAWNW